MNRRERENKTRWVLDKIESAGSRGDVNGLENLRTWAVKNRVNSSEIEDAYRAAMEQAAEPKTPDYDYDRA